MTKIAKLLAAATTAFTICSLPAFGSAGIFGTGGLVTLKINGVTTNDLLEATLLGDSRLQPNAPTVSPISYDSSGNDATAGAVNLGTFNVAAGSTDILTFDGGEVLTYKSGNDNFTGADVYYSVDGGSFIKDPLAFNQNIDGNGDQRWYTDTTGANLLTGLTNGSHTVSFYFDATDNYGTGIYTPVVNNGANNYSATFTVVPEPSSAMMLLDSSAFGTFYLMRRRRRI